MALKIYSFNVNGIRSALNKGFAEWLKTEQPDIIGFQEIKATKEQIDTSVFESLGYSDYWFSAEKKGYSGVGLLTKIKPLEVKFGFNNPTFDSEGRVIQARFKDFTVLVAYFPSGTSGDIRQDLKMKFLEEFQSFILDLKKSQPNLLLFGDFNIAHKEIDINHPKKHVKMSGFLPEERDWFTKFLDKGFIDTFRIFNTLPEQYSWWTYRAGAREKNLGWRIDYHLVTDSLKPYITNAQIHSGVAMSDHCPVSVTLNI